MDKSKASKTSKKFKEINSYFSNKPISISNELEEQELIWIPKPQHHSCEREFAYVKGQAKSNGIVGVRKCKYCD